VKRTAIAALCCFFAIFFMAGCASQKRTGSQNSLYPENWRGRLAVRVQADPSQGQTRDQAFSAEFDLHGNAQQGDLLFYTPLGSTAAVIHWEPGKAELLTNGEPRTFTDLNRLIRELLGTEVPIESLFLWLAGKRQDTAGWQVDLTDKAQGKITARRLEPPPVAELKLILEN
jgi:outer membrane lipoprotein LolB